MAPVIDHAMGHQIDALEGLPRGLGGVPGQPDAQGDCRSGGRTYHGAVEGDERVMSRGMSQCDLCARLRWRPAIGDADALFLDEGRQYYCEAFPAGIPDRVFSGRVDHSLPVRGDQGVRFEPRSPEDGRTQREMFTSSDEGEA